MYEARPASAPWLAEDEGDWPLNADGSLQLPGLDPITDVSALIGSATDPVVAAADTVSGGLDTSASVAVGGFVAGEIDFNGDHDWYRVELIGGQTYTIQTILPGAGLPDSYLVVRNAAGTSLAENDDASSSPNHYTFSEITFTAPSTGTYFLDVSGFETFDIGTFYLTVSAPVADAVAGSASTSASLTIGSPTSGQFDSTGDHDWYAVQLTAGQSYVFSTSPTGALSDPNTTLALRNGSGGLLAYNDNASGTYSQIRFTPSTTGTYYLDVGAWGNAETGAYKVMADLAPPLPLYTYDEIAFQLTNTYWGGTSRRFNVSPGGTLTVNVTALTADGQYLAREALKLWTDATGINFQEVTTGGQITFDDNQTGAFSTSSRSGGFIISSKVNVAESWLTTYGNTVRGYAFQAYVHEIGHSLGLGHGGNYNTTATYPADASYANDSWATTIMSYFDQAENAYFAGLGFTRQYSVTPMIADLVAVQSLYGSSTGTRTGNTTYGFNNDSGRDIYTAAVGQSRVGVTIVDNGGIDTLDYSGFSSNQRLDLNAETFSNIGGGVGNLSIARGTVIENAFGGNGNDVLVGNFVANTLRGGNGADTITGSGGNDSLFGDAGNDVLDGGLGADTMTGGIGDDLFLVDDALDVVVENSAEGTDTVQTALGTSASASTLYYLPANVENVLMTNAAGQAIVGNALDNAINGTDGTDLIVIADAASPFTSAALGNDTVSAGGGNDFIFTGRGLTGLDLIDGGAGYDIVGVLGPNYSGLVLGAGALTGVEQLSLYSSGNAGDPYSYAVTTNDGNVAAGQQLLVTAASLQANETLNFNGAAETNGKFLVFGGRGADTIVGGSGADRLIGGLGGDMLTGGAGNDAFQFNSKNDSTPAARDTITDFRTGDRIDLWFVDANDLVGGSQHFTFIGNAAFSGAGQLRVFEQSSGNWLIEGDTNGDGQPDLSIAVTVADGHALGLADFLL